MTGRRVICFAVLAICALPAAAEAKPRPDLVVAKASPLAASVVQKGRVQVSITVKNAGTGRAPASAAGLFLSKDKRRSKSDQRLGSLKIKALAKGKRATRRGRVKLPRKVKPGAYVLIACADVKRKIRERKEGNNCRAAKRKLGVSAAAKPVHVSPHLDPAHAASGIVTPEQGGALATFAADGTTFALIVPPHAVTHAQRVALTPVTKIDGLPLSGGLVAAAQVGTEAFQLAKPAKLVILRNGVAPGPSQVAFGYRAGGSNFFLAPFGSRPAGYPKKSLVVPVLHGGGYGVGNGTAADVAKQKAKKPVHPEDWLSQTAAKRGAPAKRAARVTAAALLLNFDDQAQALYKQQIKPQLEAAGTNDALLDKAASDAIEWMREITLLGGEDDYGSEFTEISNLIGKGLENAYKQARKRCLDGDYKQVTRLIAIERFRQLLGFSSEASTLFEDIDNCLRFELRVTSHIEVHEHPGGGDTVDQVSELKSTVPLEFEFNNMSLHGEAPFDYKKFTFSAVTHLPGNCTPVSSHTGQLHDGDLNVFDAAISAGDPGVPDSKPQVSLLFDPGHPEEQIHTTYSGCSGATPTTQFETHWLDEWSVIFHLDDAIGNDFGGYVITGFTPGTKPVVGTRHYTIVAGARTLDETWEVVHTPVR